MADWLTDEWMGEATDKYGNHNWAICEEEDCQYCQWLVDNGFVMGCDGCDQPGHTECIGGWMLMDDGRTLCMQCYDDEEAKEKENGMEPENAD